jgi:hypothetical protein
MFEKLEKFRIPGLLLLCLFMIGVCVWAYPGGDAEDRAILPAMAVLFAACAVVFGSLLLPKQELRPEPDGSIIIPGPRVRYLILGVCLATVAIIAPFVTAPARAIGWVNDIELWFVAFVLAAGAAYLLWASFAASVIWRLDRIGVECLYGVHWRLPWSAVASLDYIFVAHQPYLALRLEPGAEEPRIGVNRLARWLGVPPFALGAQGSSADFDDITDHAIRLWRQAREGR